MSYKFDPECTIWLHMSTAGSYEYRREFLGKNKKGVTEASVDVSNMTDPSNLRLTLKVSLDKSNKKVLVGLLKNFEPRVPQNETNQRSFFSIVKDDALEVPWEVRFVLGEPVLVISGKKNVFSVLKTQSTIFIPSILPEAVRQICVWAALDKERENLEKFAKWERFLIGLGANEQIFDRDLFEEEDEQNWYNEIQDNAATCAKEFSRKYSFLDQINLAYLGDEGGINV